MGNILYGDIKSEHMIFNETDLPETVISALYRSVSKYSFGYNIFNGVGMWYYVNKYNQRGAGYISCVCKDSHLVNEEEYEDFACPLNIFDTSFHSISEFEEKYINGSYNVKKYNVTYPSKFHITEMYRGLLSVLPNNGKIVVYMPSSQGREVFISNAVYLLERFIYVLPSGLRNTISFSIGEENNQDNVNISVVSSYVQPNFRGVFIDTTVESKVNSDSNTLADYWARCFDSDDYFEKDLEDIFNNDVKNNKIIKENAYSKIFNLPYSSIYNFFNKPTVEGYRFLKLNYKDTLDLKSMTNRMGWGDFEKKEPKIENEPKISDEEKIKELQRQEDIKKNVERKRHENNFQGWLQYIDDYVGIMKERFNKGSKCDKFQDTDDDRKEYRDYMDFFACMQKIAQDKSRNYGESTGEKTNIHWSDTDWKVPFNEENGERESYEKFDLKHESVPFELPYLKLQDKEYLSNIYSGLLIYLQSIQKVNYIDEAAKKKAEKDSLARDYSYNHSCYGRSVSNIVFYRTNSGSKYTATLDYRIFLDITSLICLYVFVDDITEGYSGFGNINKENIKDLMKKRFLGQDTLKNIAFYHCSFLYSSTMGFFETFDKLKIAPDLVERAKKFDVADSMKWLQERLEPQSKNKISENTLQSFIKKTEKETFNFKIYDKMKQLKKRMK